MFILGVKVVFDECKSFLRGAAAEAPVAAALFEFESFFRTSEQAGLWNMGLVLF